MRAFAEAWPEIEFVQQVIAQLPWGHQTHLLDRTKDRPTREWYLNAAVEHGWSQSVLVHQISSRLHERQGKALTNFSQALPREGSDLAEQISESCRSHCATKIPSIEDLEVVVIGKLRADLDDDPTDEAFRKRIGKGAQVPLVGEQGRVLSTYPVCREF